MYRLLILLIMTAEAIGMAAQTQRTTRKGLKPVSARAVTDINRAASAADTVFCPSADSIKISGYDKPLRSAQETMFITNRTGSTVSRLRLSIRYYDSHGRELHSRESSVDCTIPPGSTRQISLKSWDIQRSFYYKRSTRPKRTDATPYDITCDILYYLTD